MSALDRPQTIVFSLFIHHGLVYVRQNRNSLRWNRYLLKLEPIQFSKKNYWYFQRLRIFSNTRWGESQQTGDQPRSGCWKMDWGLLDTPCMGPSNNQVSKMRFYTPMNQYRSTWTWRCDENWWTDDGNHSTTSNDQDSRQHLPCQTWKFAEVKTLPAQSGTLFQNLTRGIQSSIDWNPAP